MAASSSPSSPAFAKLDLQRVGAESPLTDSKRKRRRRDRLAQIRAWENKLLDLVEKTQVTEVNLSDLELPWVSHRIWNLHPIGTAPFITVLNLSMNLISEIPTELAQLSTLEELYLKSNNISTVPPNLFQAVNRLRVLDLSDNILSSIPSDIKYLRELEDLVLSDNRITEVIPELFLLEKLNGLSLKGNAITQLPSKEGSESLYSGLSRLLVLDISSNQLTELPSCIISLTQLQELYINNNKIKKLPEAIGNLSNLMVLDASNNQLQELPTSLCQLELVVLSIRNNQLPHSLQHGTGSYRMNSFNNLPIPSPEPPSESRPEEKSSPSGKTHDILEYIKERSMLLMMSSSGTKLDAMASLAVDRQSLKLSGDGIPTSAFLTASTSGTSQGVARPKSGFDIDTFIRSSKNLKHDMQVAQLQEEAAASAAATVSTAISSPSVAAGTGTQSLPEGDKKIGMAAAISKGDTSVGAAFQMGSSSAGSPRLERDGSAGMVSSSPRLRRDSSGSGSPRARLTPRKDKEKEKREEKEQRLKEQLAGTLPISLAVGSSNSSPRTNKNSPCTSPKGFGTPLSMSQSSLATVVSHVPSIPTASVIGTFFKQIPGYRCEEGTPGFTFPYEESNMQLNGAEVYTPFYATSFFGKRKFSKLFLPLATRLTSPSTAHANYVGCDPYLGLVVASVMKQPEGMEANSHYLALVRTEVGKEIGVIPSTLVKKSFLSNFPSHSNLIAGLKAAVNPPLLQEATLVHVKNPKIMHDLFVQEERMVTNPSLAAFLKRYPLTSSSPVGEEPQVWSPVRNRRTRIRRCNLRECGNVAGIRGVLGLLGRTNTVEGVGQVQRRTGCGKGQDGKGIDLHRMERARNHVPRLHPAALQCQQLPTAREEVPHRQRCGGHHLPGWNQPTSSRHLGFPVQPFVILSPLVLVSSFTDMATHRNQMCWC